MPHIHAPLTPTGWLRMVAGHLDDGIPKAHVAAEFRVSRPTVTTWVARYLEFGEAGLVDRSSAPHTSRTRIPAAVVELIEGLRREHKWSSRRIHRHLRAWGTSCICARWDGGWPAWAFPACGISPRRARTPAGARPGSVLPGPGTWCTWM